MKAQRRCRQILFLLGLAACAVADEVALPAGPGPLDNPLKGFAAYSAEGFQHTGPVTMAYAYASWRELEPREGQYAFDAWEKREWEAPLAKGKHMVFRVTLDYPGRPTSVPQWLIDKGVKMNPYDQFGGGKSPDYESPVLQAALVKLIQQLGKRYDQDPRVAFVQLGVLGHWGEWHTYPKDELFASESAQRKVVEAMHAAFPHKHIMARNAAYKSVQVPWIGFHDDMIPEDTLGSDPWNFLSAMKTGGRQDNWKVAPTGGEMVPGETKKYLGDEWPTLVKAVEQAHFTWIGPYAPPLETPPNDVYRQRMDELVRKLGYEYRWTSIDRPVEIGANKELSFSLKGTNQGVAPFYYPWQVQYALIDSSDKAAQVWDSPADIRKWLPGNFQAETQASVTVAPGDYWIAVGIVDPYTKQRRISFANDLKKVDGFTLLAPIRVVAGNEQRFDQKNGEDRPSQTFEPSL
jgi:hypothetical protein